MWRKTKRISCYLSHPIRGKEGVKASNRTMERNCNLAIEFGQFIRLHIPELDVYVPGDHEDFVHKAYKKKYVSEKEILDIDCDIVKEGDFVILLGAIEDCVGGCRIEIDCANIDGIPIFSAGTRSFDLFLIRDLLNFLEKYNWFDYYK